MYETETTFMDNSTCMDCADLCDAQISARTNSFLTPNDKELEAYQLKKLVKKTTATINIAL